MKRTLIGLATAAVALTVAVTAMALTDQVRRKRNTVLPPAPELITVTKHNLRVTGFKLRSEGSKTRYDVNFCLDPWIWKQGMKTEEHYHALDFDIGVYHHRATAPKCGDKADHKYRYMHPKGAKCGGFSIALDRPKGGERAWLMLDNTCLVDEKNENDNTAFERPDLSARVVDLSGSPKHTPAPAGKAKRYFKVCNAGGATSKPVMLGLAYGHPMTKKRFSSGTPFNEYRIIPALKTGSCTTTSWLFPKKTARRGRYRGWLRVDPKYGIKETNEKNNTVGFVYSIGAAARRRR
jgi:hypothetical protein